MRVLRSSQASEDYLSSDSSKGGRSRRTSPHGYVLFPSGVQRAPVRPHRYRRGYRTDLRVDRQGEDLRPEGRSRTKSLFKDAIRHRASDRTVGPGNLSPAKGIRKLAKRGRRQVREVSATDPASEWDVRTYRRHHQRE